MSSQEYDIGRDVAVGDRYKKVDSSWVVEWTDLTPYVVWESGDTTVEVGAKPRAVI